jgi:hypothetical protein
MLRIADRLRLGTFAGIVLPFALGVAGQGAPARAQSSDGAAGLSAKVVAIVAPDPTSRPQRSRGAASPVEVIDGSGPPPRTTSVPVIGGSALGAPATGAAASLDYVPVPLHRPASESTPPPDESSYGDDDAADAVGLPLYYPAAYRGARPHRHVARFRGAAPRIRGAAPGPGAHR